MDFNAFNISQWLCLLHTNFHNSRASSGIPTWPRFRNGRTMCLARCSTVRQHPPATFVRTEWSSAGRPVRSKSYWRTRSRFCYLTRCRSYKQRLKRWQGLFPTWGISVLTLLLWRLCVSIHEKEHCLKTKASFILTQKFALYGYKCFQIVATIMALTTGFLIFVKTVQPEHTETHFDHFVDIHVIGPTHKLHETTLNCFSSTQEKN